MGQLFENIALAFDKSQQDEAAMIDRVFLDHPHSVDESYGEHFLFATRFSMVLFLAAGAAFVHAIIPCLFEKTASRMVGTLYQRTHNRGK